MAGRPEKLNDSACCLICGFSRSLDRCHLIPRRFLKNLKGGRYKKFTSFNASNLNMILLCKNHHFLFDTFKLMIHEWKMLLPSLIAIKSDILEFLNSKLMKKAKRTPKESRPFRHWQYKLGYYLVLCGFLEYSEDIEKLKLQIKEYASR